MLCVNTSQLTSVTMVHSLIPSGVNCPEMEILPADSTA